MYRGYPVGYLLLWENGLADPGRVIGTDGKQKIPQLLIVDGQQRLTSLYAVMKGIPVVRENWDSENIEIAFNPLNETFEVADAAIRRDRSFIPNISLLWNQASLLKFVALYFGELEKVRPVTEEEQRKIEDALTRVYNLTMYPFTALELSKEISEEQVAEVFVRINSQGKALNQADFILTLMSVFWDVGRAELETFSRLARIPSNGEPSPYNHFIEPDPDQLLRVSVGVGFKRARLQYVYSILRGKDLETEKFSDERRDEQFAVLKEAQARTVNLQHWHDFFKALTTAGYLGGGMISSKNGLLFTYLLYLLGRTEYGVPEHILRRVISRWFFMASLTGRYTSSPETRLEFDLARFRKVTDAKGFVEVLETVCSGELTGDFWTITLPNDLATSSPRSPSLFAYIAALNLLDAQALFSSQKVSFLLDPSVHANRSAAERHHLFPKAHLQKQGITDHRETNQVANYALIEWGANAEISDTAPDNYLPVMTKRVKAKELKQQYYWHALPDGWESMDYKEFLIARRDMIARVIREGYETLMDGPGTAPTAPAALPVVSVISGGEGVNTEFKSALRVNLHTSQPDPRIELTSLKTIAGFLNSQGGTLIIGVSDDGEPVGVPGADQFPSEDKMNLHLVNILVSRIGAQFMLYVHPRFEDFQGSRVMAVECWPAKSPVFVKDGGVERFYIRAGASTAELPAGQAQGYIKQRFDA
jgi:hypothetical protein